MPSTVSIIERSVACVRLRDFSRHRHSLTIETNPLHLLPSNMRRFSQADSLRHPAAPMLAKLQANVPPEIP
ncbi:unnamed protein product, partial [Strongylus vulgaris]